MKIGVLGLILVTSAATMLAESHSDADNRLQQAGTVFREVMGTPDKGIPRDLFDRAKCIVIIPNMKKAGFVVGGEYGKGVMTCRAASSPSGWSDPVTMKVEGGSFGAQIGAAETDLILVVMNESGVNKLLNDKFTVGVDGTVAAGPVGRDAQAKTDAFMSAEMLAYSRARGAFAGITLNGSTLRHDRGADEKIYGRDLSAKDIINGNIAPLPAAQPLYSALNFGESGTRARTNR